MGDRGNIVVRYNSAFDGKKFGDLPTQKDIYLYTHWGGTEIADVVKRVLSRNERWEDDAYLARMLFDELVGKENHGEETGFGISPSPCDNEHDFVVVFPDKQKVIIEDAKTRAVKKEWSFKEFIELKEPVEV